MTHLDTVVQPPIYILALYRNLRKDAGRTVLYAIFPLKPLDLGARNAVDFGPIQIWSRRWWILLSSLLHAC